MAVDTDEERINDVLPFVTKAQIGDSTNAEFLRALGIRNFDVCFVTISEAFPKLTLGTWTYISKDCLSPA